MISETLLIPFVLWCAYMPPEPSDYQERPQICGRIYNTKEKCIEQQAHVDEMFLPKCAPLKTNGTQTSASRTVSRLHHPVVAAGHSAGSIDDTEVFTLSTGAYFLWCSSHDLNQCNRIYASRGRCIEEFMTAPTEDARCLPLKFDTPPAAFQNQKSQDRHPNNIDAQQQGARPPAVAQPAAGQTDYVVQVATFRSESEAAGEFRRLQFRHPQFLGTLQRRIQRVELGASGTFYRLGVGPLSTKDQAHGLCKSLIAAGEKDCLVRRQ